MEQKSGKEKLSKYEKVDLLKIRDTHELASEIGEIVHIIRDNVICKTDIRGYTIPQGQSRTDIVVDTSEGFIPLWEKGVNLRWRFQEQSFVHYQNSNAIKEIIKTLLGEALLKWGDAAPIKFTHRQDAWDFEVVMKEADECNRAGCVLASAFFPDAGRHELVIYPKMFEQSEKEQIDTLVHEIGHIFGLRHFFANLTENQWPSTIFGTHSPFSIMNYGKDSELTSVDRSDLKILYEKVWSRAINEINGTPIRLIRPFHTVTVADRILNVTTVEQI